MQQDGPMPDRDRNWLSRRPGMGLGLCLSCEACSHACGDVVEKKPPFSYCCGQTGGKTESRALGPAAGVAHGTHGQHVASSCLEQR